MLGILYLRTPESRRADLIGVDFEIRMFMTMLGLYDSRDSGHGAVRESIQRNPRGL
jgi:hypothetical protein